MTRKDCITAFVFKLLAQCKSNTRMSIAETVVLIHAGNTHPVPFDTKDIPFMDATETRKHVNYLRTIDLVEMVDYVTGGKATYRLTERGLEVYHLLMT
jgi:hypothetical protein